MVQDKNDKQEHDLPAVILINPKFSHNVGGVLRACSCFGIKTLWWTGNRVVIDKAKGERLPREERMKGFRDVRWGRCQYPFNEPVGIGKSPVPVAVELHKTAESLTDFEHPENAVYVFGPEDGGIPKAIRTLCHRFVFIPSHHCLNLSAAVNVILYDRRLKRQIANLEPALTMGDLLHEHRGYLDTPVLDSMGWDGK